MKLKPTIALLSAGLLAGALSGCPSTEELDTAHSIHELPPPTIPAASALTLHSLTGVVPATPAGAGLAWTLERLNLAPEAATAEAVQAAFDATVLEQAAPRAIADQLQRVGRERPFALVGFVEAPSDQRLVAAVMHRGGYQKLTVEVTSTGQMKVLLFEVLEPGDGPGTSLPPRELGSAPVAAAAGSAEGSGEAMEGSADAASAAGSGEAAAAPEGGAE